MRCPRTPPRRRGARLRTPTTRRAGMPSPGPSPPLFSVCPRGRRWYVAAARGGWGKGTRSHAGLCQRAKCCGCRGSSPTTPPPPHSRFLLLMALRWLGQLPRSDSGVVESPFALGPALEVSLTAEQIAERERLQVRGGGKSPLGGVLPLTTPSPLPSFFTRTAASRVVPSPARLFPLAPPPPPPTCAPLCLLVFHSCHRTWCMGPARVSTAAGGGGRGGGGR
jgi:hypothetical protein